MKSKTLVCSYGKTASVEQIFERLYAMYLSNYSEHYVYCALIDLPDGDMYRMAGDSDIEERAQAYTKRLISKCGERFFCGIRQRRIGYEKRGYSCENGVAGAIENLWRFVNGRENSLYPTYGFDQITEAKCLYFSSCDEKPSLTVIEPGGLFKLCSVLGENDVVFAPAGAIDGQKRELLCGGFCAAEALYSALALDKMLFAEPCPFTPVPVYGVGFSIFEAGDLRKIANGII